MRGDGDDRRRRVARSASLHARAPRGSGAIEMTGFDGPMTIARARRRSPRAPPAGARAASMPCELDAVDRPLAALADHELLEGHPAPARQHARAHRLVGHRQHARAQPERRARARRCASVSVAPSARRCARRRPMARSRSPRLNQTSTPSSRSCVHRVEGVAAQAPAALVDAVGQPEGARGRGRARRRRRRPRRRRPVLATTTSSSPTTSSIPRASLAPPVPPARTTTTARQTVR